MSRIIRGRWCWPLSAPSPRVAVNDVCATYTLLVRTASLITTLIHESNLSAPATPLPLLLILPKIADESPNCRPKDSNYIRKKPDDGEQVVVDADPVVDQLLHIVEVHENGLVRILELALLVLELDGSELRLIQLRHHSLVVPHALLVLLLQGDSLLAKVTLVLGVRVLRVGQRGIQCEIQLLLNVQLLLLAFQRLLQFLLLLAFLAEFLPRLDVHLDAEIDFADLGLSTSGVRLLKWSNRWLTKLAVVDSCLSITLVVYCVRLLHPLFNLLVLLQNLLNLTLVTIIT